MGFDGRDGGNLPVVAAVVVVVVGVVTIGAFVVLESGVESLPGAGGGGGGSVASWSWMWQRSASGGNVSLVLQGGPAVALERVELVRGNVSLDVCLVDSCDPGALVRVGDWLTARCEGSGDVWTEVRVDGVRSSRFEVRC